MKFDIGNLLYVIITIVVIAVGLLGKKKKPAGQGDGGTGAVRKPGFLENLEKLLDQEQRAGYFGEEVTGTVQNEGAGYVIEDEVTGYVTEDEGSGSVFEEEGTTSGFEDDITRSVLQQEPASGGIMEAYERMMKRQAETPVGETAPLEVIQLDEESGTDYFEVITEFNAARAIVYSAIINRIDY